MTEIEARFILGLGHAFSAAELRRAYREAAADNHPDRGGRPARMVLVNQALERLRPRPRSRSVESPTSQAHSPHLGAPAARDVEVEDHPSNRNLIRVSVVLALALWICGFPYTDQSSGWPVLGFPICYVVAFSLGWVVFSVVGAMARCGIRVYHAGTRIYGYVILAG